MLTETKGQLFVGGFERPIDTIKVDRLDHTNYLPSVIVPRCSPFPVLNDVIYTTAYHLVSYEIFNDWGSSDFGKSMESQSMDRKSGSHRRRGCFLVRAFNNPNSPTWLRITPVKIIAVPTSG